MKITKKNLYSYEGSDSRWLEINWFDHFEYLNDVKEDLYSIKRLIETDFKNISDEEFYNIVSRFYSIFLTKNDILNILSKTVGKEFDRFEVLKTRMTYKDTVSEGHGRDFSWWEETFEIDWIVAATKDFILDKNHNYSKDEIRELIRNKQIVKLSNRKKPIGMNPKLSYESEEVESINTHSINIGKMDYMNFISYDELISLNSIKYDDSDFEKELYHRTISLLRKNLSKKRILTDFKKILLFLNDNIYTLCELISKKNVNNENEKNQNLELVGSISDMQKKLSRSLSQNCPLL